MINPREQILRETVGYDPIAGRFYWRSSGPRRVAGKTAGTYGRGYHMVTLDGVTYQAGRLAWFLVYGHWPSGEIDHINRDPSDNRLSNLREVSRSENMINTRVRGRIKEKNISKNGSGYMVRIKRNYIYHYVGNFPTIEKAIEARDDYLLTLNMEKENG